MTPRELYEDAIGYENRDSAHAQALATNTFNKARVLALIEIAEQLRRMNERAERDDTCDHGYTINCPGGCN